MAREDAEETRDEGRRSVRGGRGEERIGMRGEGGIWHGSKTRNGGERVRFPLGRNRNLLLHLFLYLFFSSSFLTEPRSLALLSFLLTYRHTLCLSFSFLLYTPLTPFRSSFQDSSLFRRYSPRLRSTAGRSAPDYLGSEYLIEALYRWDSELLAPLLGFGEGDTPPRPRLPAFSFSLPLTPISCILLLSLPLPLPPLYVYSFICWWLIPHYRDRSTDKRNVLGNTQCAPPSSRLSRSFS